MPTNQDGKRPHWPYGIGVLVGFTMVALFLLGYRFIAAQVTVIGTIMVYTGLVLWPAYAGLTIILTWRTNLSQALWTRAMVRSQVMVPAGAVMALLTIVLLYRVFGGV